MESLILQLVCYVVFGFLYMTKGQEIFPLHHAHCSGLRQSPIDIQTNSVVYGRQISIDYNLQSVSLNGWCRNNGYYFICEAEPGYRITGVPYNEGTEYELYKWHLHVGRNNFEGSEHTVNGYSYAGEIHMVFWNTEYESYKEALNFHNGRAVVSVFIQAGPDTRSDHPWIDEFLRSILPLVQTPGREFLVEIPVTDIIPDDSGIYTYSGSSTLPPCEQNVQWIIYAEPIILSETTLQLARQLLDSRGYPIGLLGNFRPIQRQYGRIVEANFLPYDYR